MVPAGWRSFAGMVPMHTWVVSYVILAMAAYLIRDWTYLQLFSVGSLLPAFIGLLYVSHS